MELVYYTPHKLYTYHKIASIDSVQVSFAQMFNASISLVDRSETINCPPIKVKNLYPLPPTWHDTKSFEQLCKERYEEIYNRAVSENKRLVLFYSGGIDSTLITVLAMMHRADIANDNILLVFSEESIKENPVFWEKFIVPNFKTKIANASGFYRYISDNQNLCVTGEFADNIFGSLTLKSYMDVSADVTAIHKPFNDTGLKWLINKINFADNKPKCEELIQKILETSPRELTSNHDCFWWLNFILKWQAVNFRLASHSPSEKFVGQMITNVVHFFDTLEFQNWAVTTSEDKVKDDWYSYKLPAKKIIYDFNKDEYYFKWKTKYPSIPGLTRYSNMYDFIYWNNGEYIASKELLNLNDVQNKS